MFRIVSDSSCDIFDMEGIEFKSVPLKIIAGEKEFCDTEDADVHGMVTFLRDYKDKSGSSCPSGDDWLGAFSGADEVFALTITSALSGSYNSACVAANMYMEKNPGSKVHIIDSLSTGPEMTLIIEKIKELHNEGRTFEEIKNEIDGYKKNTGLCFVLESLKNLANNGRVSHTVSALVNILGIRLVGKASDEGTLEPLVKTRGEKKAFSSLLKIMREEGYKGKKVIISHCFNEEGANAVKQKIKELFLSAEVKIQRTGMLCSFYAEEGGLLIGFEK